MMNFALGALTVLGLEIALSAFAVWFYWPPSIEEEEDTWC